jgi:hypothetical protein
MKTSDGNEQNNRMFGDNYLERSYSRRKTISAYLGFSEQWNGYVEFRIKVA